MDYTAKINPNQIVPFLIPLDNLTIDLDKLIN